MPLKKNPSLNEILAMFKNTLEKDASEGVVPEGVVPEGAAPEGVVPAQACPNCGDPACDGSCQVAPADPNAEVQEAGVSAEDLAAAAEAVDAAQAHAEEAKEEALDAKETLKEVADEFINEHTAALTKEAQVFGQLFAASCIEEMNKQAALEDASTGAYHATQEALQQNVLQKCAAEAYQLTLDTLGGDAGEALPLVKQAALYEAAYKETFAKLAGYEDAEAMEEDAGRELTPEEVAAIYQAAQGEAGEGEALPEEAAEAVADEAAEPAENPLEDLSDEELADLAEQISSEVEARNEADVAASEAAEADAAAPEAEPEGGPVSPEAVAQAANLLAAAREGEDGGEEKMASLVSRQAYEAALKALRGE